MSGSNDLHGDYARAGFAGHLSFGANPALLLVDAVTAYVDPQSPLYAHGEAALACMARIVSVCHSANIPVIFTNVVYQMAGVDGGQFYRKVPALKAFDAGSSLGAFPDELLPALGDLVVTKQYASAFFGTSLASTFTAMGIDTVLIGGFSTSGCVRASALDALQHGFAPFIVRDACADRAPEPHEANLFDLQAKYAEVISEAEALRHIAGIAPG
jgi:maleamate amidohydrolase